jgi:transcriptional regulator with XRE-family HTH domain
VNVGQNVKRIREEQRYTQTEIARRCGVTPAAISGLEHGDFTPSTPLLVKLARALDVSVEELLDKPVLLGKAEAPQEPGQLEEALPGEEHLIPQSAGTLKTDVDWIKRLKSQHISDLEQIRRGELGDDAVLRMETVDMGVRAKLNAHGVLEFAEAVRDGREFAQPEAIPLCHELLRELTNLESLTAEARSVAAMKTSDIHEEVEKDVWQAESWVGERGRGA